jgi:hypothetical protein
MTHDELLIEINRRLDVAYYNGDPQSMRALRAVVELHKPEHCIRGYRCAFDDELFPCKHHQAIEKELA